MKTMLSSSTLILYLFLFVTILHVLLAQSSSSTSERRRTPWKQSLISKRIGCIHSSSLACIDSFLEEQIENFPSNNQLIQTWRVGWDYSPRIGYPIDFGSKLSSRADIYDAALTVIYMLNRQRVNLAKKICNTLVVLLDNDPVGDGRLFTSYNVYSPMKPVTQNDGELEYSANPVDKSIVTGDLAMVVIALGRFYHHTKEYRYLKAAIKIAKFIDTECKGYGSRGGYTAGYYWDESNKSSGKWFYRSTEHNIAVYAAARLLNGLTGDSEWKSIMVHAEKFIQQLWDNSEQAYMIGTANIQDDDTISDTNVAIRSQVWELLRDSSNLPRDTMISNWVWKNGLVQDVQTDENGSSQQYEGIKYGKGGVGLQSEVTAATAMSLWLLSKKAHYSDSRSLKENAKKLLLSLKKIQQYAPNSDGHGIVASVQQEGSLVWAGDEYAGTTWRYFPLLHVASTVWTGLAIQAIEQNNDYADPFSAYYERDVTSSSVTTVFGNQIGTDEPVAVFDNQKLTSMAVTSIILSLFTLTIFFGYLSYRGLSKYLYTRKQTKQEFGNMPDLQLKVHRQIPLPKRLEGLMMTPTPNTPTPSTPTV
jgi:hypothetical protein